MAGMDQMFGTMSPGSPEEEQELQALLQRVMQTSQAAMGGLDDRTQRQLPFGMLVQQDRPADRPQEVGMARSEAQARAKLPTSQSPSTTPFRTTLEPPVYGSETPKDMSVPQTAKREAPARQPAPAGPSEAAPRVSTPQNLPRAPEPTFWDRLGALSRGYNTGGLVGGIADAFGPGLERQAEQGNLTIQALVKQGVPPEMAAVAARNPDVMKLMLAQMFNKTAPDLKTIKVKDRYGRETEIPVTYNQATKRWERVDIDGSGATTPASGATAGGGGMSAPTLPAGAPAAAGGPAAPSAAPTRQAPAGWTINENIPITSLPAAPKGKAYDDIDGYALTDKNGNLKLIGEKDAESRNPADDAAKLRDMIDGIDKSFNAANELTYHPGLPGVAGRNLAGEAKLKGMGLDVSDLYAGTDTADAFNQHKALLSDVALRTMDRLKSQSATGATGFGALSEKELEILTQSAGNLKVSSSFEELTANYKKFQDALMRSRDRLMQKFQDKYGMVPEGIASKQQLIDSATAAALAKEGRPTVRPRQFWGFDIPGTSTTDPAPGATAAPPRGVPNTPPPGARDLPPGAGYPPGSKAVPNPNKPGQWIIWTPD